MVWLFNTNSPVLFMCLVCHWLGVHLVFLHIQQSWADKMIERVRNVVKQDSKRMKRSLTEGDSEVPKKKEKKGPELL